MAIVFLREFKLIDIIFDCGFFPGKSKVVDEEDYHWTLSYIVTQMIINFLRNFVKCFYSNHYLVQK